jgi:hypothetical protein
MVLMPLMPEEHERVSEFVVESTTGPSLIISHNIGPPQSKVAAPVIERISGSTAKGESTCCVME